MEKSTNTFRRQAIKIVTLCVLWYTFSSINNVLAKQILTEFPYPITLSMVHLIAINCFLGPVLTLMDIEPTPHLSRKFYLRRIVPLALGKIFASISAHVSLWKVPISYAHTVKALMPIFTVCLSTFVLGETYPLKVYLTLIPIVSGVLVATVTELHFDMMGMMAALMATLFFALQNIYSKKCMREVHIHHLRLLLLLSQLAFFCLFPLWMYTDVWNIITNLHKVQHLGWLMVMFPIDGFGTFCQNMVAFSMISAVSPVSYSVANVTKRIVVIGSSLMVLKNPVTVSNVCGMMLAITGIALYNKVKYNSNKRSKHRDSLLPTTHQIAGLRSSTSIIPSSTQYPGMTNLDTMEEVAATDSSYGTSASEQLRQKIKSGGSRESRTHIVGSSSSHSPLKII